MLRRSSSSGKNRDEKVDNGVAELEAGQHAQPATSALSPPRAFSHSWRDAEIAGPRAGFIKGIVSGTLLTIVAVLGILSVYWSAFWKVPDHASALGVVVVDFDGGAIGSAVRDVFSSPLVTGGKNQLSYTIAPPGTFETVEDAAHHVLGEHVWAAVVVAPDASGRLATATSTRDASYNASDAITVFVTGARNENAVPRLVLPQVTATLNRFVVQFAEAHARTGLAGVDLAALISAAPQLVTQPVGYRVNDIRPFDVPVASAVDFVGLIYLLIIAFLIAMMNFNLRVGTGLNHNLNLHSLLGIRFAVPFACYFFMSWIYSFVSLAFQVPFSRYYGHGGFLLYWMSSFLGMAALGLAVESLITILTPQFIPYFLLLWIIVNVSVAFFPLQVLPGIFRFGYAMPFYNIGQIVRTLCFDTRSHLGVNYGILIAWIVVSCVTMTLFTVYMRRKDVQTTAVATGGGR